MFDALIAGTGFCGSVIARELAQGGMRVLVVEKRGHLAGNMYDEVNEAGVLVQRYGPHVFITDKPEVLAYLDQFGSFHPCLLEADAMIDGRLVPMPFGFRAAEAMYPPAQAKELIARLKSAFPGEERVVVHRLRDHEDPLVRAFGDLLYEKDYIPYTCKQWGLPPDQIDRSVIDRVKIALSYDTRYAQQKYQVMPDEGYARLFENMLRHQGVTLRLNQDVLDALSLDEGAGTVSYPELKPGAPVVFTGPVDELFRLQYGRLPYRSLRFEQVNYPVDRVQRTATVAYPQAEGFTRITEYKLLTGQRLPGATTLVKEFPLAYDPENPQADIPYYPVLNPENRAVYARYREKADRFPALRVCGRLGDYRYYNMDDAILRALSVARELLGK